MGCTHSKKRKTTSDKEKKGVLADPPLLAAAAKLKSPPKKKISPVLVAPPSVENIVSAAGAQPPHFEETGREADEKQWCKQAVEEWMQKSDSQESGSFRWPTAYEERKDVRKENDLRQAEKDSQERIEFLNERKREKRQRKNRFVFVEEEDTLFETPTRMPIKDFLPESV